MTQEGVEPFFAFLGASECLHGAPPRESAIRKERIAALEIYYNERTKDVTAGVNAPIITDMKFIKRFPHLIDQHTVNILLAQATDSILNLRNYGFAKCLIQTAVSFDMGKALIANNGEDDGWMVKYSQETCMVQSDLDVVRYLNKRIPCSCLCEEKKKEKKKPEIAMCRYCKKMFPRSQLKVCSRCKIIEYCSKECQILEWPAHKTPCKVLRGKMP